MKHSVALTTVFTMSLATFSHAAKASAAPTPQFQLVQSVPEETGLDDPALPHAKDLWPVMIRSAKKSIDLAQFYFASRPGEALEPVIAELENAATRGVRVRILVSSALLDEDKATAERMRKIPGAELRVLNLKGATTGILHAKYWVIDGAAVFLGSQNFDWRSLTQIHETGIYARDAADLAARFEQVFEIDWAVAAAPDADHRSEVARKAVAKTRALPPTPTGSAYELVASPVKLNPHGMRSSGDALVELLASAKSKVRIQLLYYTPYNKYAPKDRTPYWGKIDQALRDAEARGVKIQLLVSHWNLRQPDFFHLKSLAALPGIEVRVATVPVSKRLGEVPYSRVAHSKYMTVDDGLLWVGTSNWSEDYFEESRNLELILRRADLAAQTNAVFDRLWSHAITKNVLELQPEEKKVQ